MSPVWPATSSSERTGRRPDWRERRDRELLRTLDDRCRAMHAAVLGTASGVAGDFSVDWELPLLADDGERP